MSNLVKYNQSIPSLFSHRDEFVTSFDRVFNDLFEEMFPSSTKELGVGLFTKGAYPKVNVVDEDTQVVIEAEVPGLTKDQVSIEVQDGILTIRGGKQQTEQRDRPGKYIHRELKQSTFARSFQLNENLDVDKITAKFESGILVLQLPKKVIEKKPEVKRIDIK